MADRPNLVFIFSDQQRYDTLACNGNDWIKAPNLNALAERSFVFRNPYVCQTVCTPSRASIMTGLYPHTAGPVLNGIPLPVDVPAIAEMVSSDYLCGYFGKWHLGRGSEAQHGFTHWVSTEDSGGVWSPDTPPRLSDYHQHLVDSGFEPDTQIGELRTFGLNSHIDHPAEHHMAPWLGGRAAEFIERNRDRPFIAYVSCPEPHSPYIGPFKDLYDPASLPVGPAFLNRPDGASLLSRVKADYFLQYMDGGDPGADRYMTSWAAVREDVTTEAGWRALRAHYFGGVMLVDMMVGRILDAIERAGLADNTIVVFTSDHGDQLGDHGMLEKRSFYEESARVARCSCMSPASRVGRSASRATGRTSTRCPPCWTLLGEPIPERLHGRSRKGVLEGTESLAEDVFMEWNGVHPGEARPRTGDAGGGPAEPLHVALRRLRPLEAEPVRQRPVRALRPGKRPTRDGQPLRRPGTARPHPRPRRPNPPLAAPHRRLGAAARRVAALRARPPRAGDIEGAIPLTCRVLKHDTQLCRLYVSIRRHCRKSASWRSS